MKKRCVAFISFLLFVMATTVSAQKMRGFDIDGSIMYSDLDEPVSFGLGGKYNIWMNPYFAFSLGGRLIYSKIDSYFDSPKENQAAYYIDDKHLLNLNAEVGIKLATPTFKGVGVFSDLSFLFDPIPYNAISIEKRIVMPTSEETKSRNKMVYTHFNPNVSLKMGLFYKLNTGGQIALGGEISSFNPYNVYKQATVDNIRLKDHLQLTLNKPTYAVFIRFSGIN